MLSQHTTQWPDTQSLLLEESVRPCSHHKLHSPEANNTILVVYNHVNDRHTIVKMKVQAGVQTLTPLITAHTKEKTHQTNMMQPKASSSCTSYGAMFSFSPSAI